MSKPIRFAGESLFTRLVLAGVGVSLVTLALPWREVDTGDGPLAQNAFGWSAWLGWGMAGALALAAVLLAAALSPRVRPGAKQRLRFAGNATLTILVLAEMGLLRGLAASPREKPRWGLAAAIAAGLCSVVVGGILLRGTHGRPARPK
jgi:hypothetical protein